MKTTKQHYFKRSQELRRELRTAIISSHKDEVSQKLAEIDKWLKQKISDLDSKNLDSEILSYDIDAIDEAVLNTDFEYFEDELQTFMREDKEVLLYDLIKNEE